MARKEKTIHYLYKTTCLVTNRYYIGMHSTGDLNDGYMGSGKRLRYSLRKHGKDNHKVEILEFFETRELLIEAEIKAITPDMVLDNNCMNLKLGGEGSFEFINENNLNNKIKQCQLGGKAFANKLKNDEVFKEIHRKQVSEAMTNNLIQETINKMKKRKYKTGEENKSFGLKYINNGFINKAVKEENLDEYLKEGWVKGRK